ncbi:flagellar basal body-associated FliL family protein [Rhizobiales bacterium]|uniref:flagellar basal body-associated FliL family protein n=1 Tax=Hongsoonwoonella zoysiae TaxID=2821844 RepID=UPI0015601D33|nr:flagellar basal body-associated FliL family protein [Hongsoonwoonella zoysiae]NRG18019.1 flagellar basal body-associated FliL family protein [Hongsoonwoonella zoysiae]
MTAEADAVEPGQEREGSTPARGKRKRIAMIGGGAAVLLAVAGTAIYFLPDSAIFSGTGGVGDDAAIQKPVVFYDLPEMTVNLSTDGRATYLKVRIALEVSDRATIDRIEPFLPRVLDAFQIYLRELRPTDLEGSSGLFRLKEELLRRINTAVYPARVEAVLFKEILIQ